MKTTTLRSCLSPAREDVCWNVGRKNKNAVQKRKDDGSRRWSAHASGKDAIRGGRWLAKVGMASMGCLTAGVLLTAPVDAVSTENLLFLEAWRGVNRAYVDKTFNHQNWLKLREQYLRKVSMNNRSETYAAIEEMLSTLNDPFTRFLDPARYDALKGGTKGVVTGVGLEVAYTTVDASKHPELMVVAPAPGSPAARAKVMSGDVLLEVDGRSVSDASLYEVGEKLQGEKGSEVSLKLRKKKGTTETVVLTRQEVVFNPVSYSRCIGIPTVPDGQDVAVGYIQILRFTNQTPYDVEEAIQKLEDQGIDQLLIDLRNNGGGSFPAGIAVSQMLLDEGDIVLVADTDGVRDIVSAEGSTIDGVTPLTLLINRGTASASEVLSGAVQDNGRGTVVGEPSFGKGLIQTLVPLSDGSAITITTAKYQTPSGRDINGVGIQPNKILSSVDLPLGDDQNFCKDLKALSFQIF